MPRPKSQPRPKSPPQPQSTPTTPSGPSLKAKMALLALGAVLVVLVALNADIFSGVPSGPKTPLPRQETGLDLGMAAEAALKLHPKVKLRTYNNDTDFKIASFTTEGTGGPVGVEVIFHKGKLYFASFKWEGAAALAIPFEKIAHDYRRWASKGSGGLQDMGGGTALREWFFDDQATEMRLRELKFNDTMMRWQELRDSSNAEAQTAFQKYRIDL